MKLKPLEPGDSVRVKYTVQVHGKDTVIYIDGKLSESNKVNSDWWLVEYQLEPTFNAPKHTSWWRKEDIISKHHLTLTDDERFEKAEKVSFDDYEGVVYHNDQYFESVEEFLGYYDILPNYVWSCTTKFVKLDLDLEGIVGEALEDNGFDGLSTHSRFDELYCKLNEVQKEFEQVASEFQVYYPNHKKAVVINESIK